MFDLNYLISEFKNNPRENIFIAGTDEVGRGPLAGPVVAAAVNLHFTKFKEQELRSLLENWQRLGVNDSKKLTSKMRQKILTNILSIPSHSLETNQIFHHQYSKNLNFSFCIKEISPLIIDEINILNASLKAMEEAVGAVCDFNRPGIVLIDGNKKFKTLSGAVKLYPIIKGDSKSLLIGLASIIAKEYRDQLMANYDQIYPGYGFKTNAGYGTAKHLEAINFLGITKIHRLTFRGVLEFCEKN